MDVFQERRYWQRFFASRFVASFLLVVIFVALVKVALLYYEIRKVKKTVLATKQEIALLEDRAADFREKIDDLEKGEGVEKEARIRFNMKKPGEQTIVIVDDTANKTEQTKEFETAGLFMWLKSFLGL